MNEKQQAAIAFALGLFTLLAVFVSHAALSDIHRGQGDLGAQWNVLRACFAAVVAFQVFILAALLRVIRGDRRPIENNGAPR